MYRLHLFNVVLSFYDQQRMSTIHDGIDTNLATPVSEPPHMTLADGTILRKGDPIITFVNRNLEPYRGCHTFIRSIPHLQKMVPNARFILVGSTKGAGYGAPCTKGNWPDQFLAEIEGQYDKSYVHFTGTLSYEHFYLCFACQHVMSTLPILSYLVGAS